MAGSSINSRVRKHRDALRLAGLRPVQIWVPDTRRPDFAEECKRQSHAVALADQTDTETGGWLNESLSDLDGWTE